MFALTALFASSLLLAGVRADPNPSEPSPGDVFNQGATCHIAWDVDTTGTWKTMNIELMTGSNTGMVHLTTVTTLDGTDSSKTTYDYPCPAVTPNSAIYFYQFTSPASTNTLWTTRFAIASTSGQTTDPSESTQPNGDKIPWGTGALQDPSSGTPPPSGSSSASGSASVTGTAASAASTTASASGSSSSAASSSTASSSASSAGVTTVKTGSATTGTSLKPFTSTSGSAGAAAASSSSSSSANAAIGAVTVDGRLLVVLGAAAASMFTLLL
ncbi:hypothetical protein PLICRDRAFT_165575 [Plicaturopsis crispa FD-325 SS-3]|nr:hypothetical protein PLICRDRAFT_165575 [Plicaturopsis crispa FD-325 SS-3]